MTGVLDLLHARRAVADDGFEHRLETVTTFADRGYRVTCTCGFEAIDDDALTRFAAHLDRCERFPDERRVGEGAWEQVDPARLHTFADCETWADLDYLIAARASTAKVWIMGFGRAFAAGYRR